MSPIEPVPATGAPDLPGYAHVASGKVRDLYEQLDPGRFGLEEDTLLMVASDRISAFDYVLSTPIPDKGRILTALSLWWFGQLEPIVGNHVVTASGPAIPEAVAGRAVLVRRLRMMPVECIARAYLTGSGLAAYRQSGAICDVQLPVGLDEASRLDRSIFTPTTKAQLGQHDLPLRYTDVVALLGGPLADRVRDLTCAIIDRGNEIARDRGILIADTKVEFGLPLETIARGGFASAGDVPIVLADEVLTPDSSRFWPADEWAPGRTQRSFDKQFVRDWLTSPASGWNRASGAPPPPLPEGVVAATRATYLSAYEALTGNRFE